MLNLDTHILIHALAGTITPRERKVLAGDEWGISAIVIWEIGKLAQLGRIEIDLDDSSLTRLLAGIHTWPITIDV
jgi:PIN domain nuclease of toxin-antitoxin system